jgi:hypothetical protein
MLDSLAQLHEVRRLLMMRLIDQLAKDDGIEPWDICSAGLRRKFEERAQTIYDEWYDLVVAGMPADRESPVEELMLELLVVDQAIDEAGGQNAFPTVH